METPVTLPRIYIVRLLEACALCDLSHQESLDADGQDVYYASTRERAEAWVRRINTTHFPAPSTHDEWWWEIWEQVLDAAEQPSALVREWEDTSEQFWHYAQNGTPLNPYHVWQLYKEPVHGGTWNGAESWVTPVPPAAGTPTHRQDEWQCPPDCAVCG